MKPPDGAPGLSPPRPAIGELFFAPALPAEGFGKAVIPPLPVEPAIIATLVSLHQQTAAG